MTEFYSLLGGKTLAELPEVPTDIVAAYDPLNDLTVVEWTNNSTYTGATTNLVQVFNDNTWVTESEVASSATTANITGYTGSSTYNIRVVVKVTATERKYPSLIEETILYKPFPSNIVGGWKFDDDLTDSYNSYDLTATQPTEFAYVTGLLNKAAQSNRSEWDDACAYYTTNATVIGTVAGTSSYTMSTWRYHPSSGLGQAGGGMGLGDNDEVEDFFAVGFHFDGNFFRINRRNDSYYSYGTVSTNTWHHIVQTFDGTTTKTYLNNVLVYTATNSDSISSQSRFIVKGRRSSDRGSTGSQKVDNSYLFSRALNENEISYLYNNGQGI